MEHPITTVASPTPPKDRQPPQASSPRRARVPLPPLIAVAAFWTACGIARVIHASMFMNFLTQLAGCALLVIFFVVWWLLQRRIPRGERLAVLLTAIAGGVLASWLSPARGGGFAWLLLTLPWVFTVWALWFSAARVLSPSARHRGLFLALCMTWGSFTLIRFEGLSGDGRPVVRWRWTPTNEELYLEERAHMQGLGAEPGEEALETASGPGDWPGFRGPDRTGEAHGLRLATDWNSHPPVLLWRRTIGPAWSSLVIAGGRLVTQEQRGDQEAIVCLDADSGRELWAHLETVRFEDDQGGPGPRATPSFADGRVFAMGATGRLSCLEARTGVPVWSRDVAVDSGAKTPMWGFTSSPLVVGERVIVFAGGDAERSLRAYDARTGEPLWSAPGGADSYSSPQAFMIDEQAQILFLGENGLNAVDLDSGELLWRLTPSTRHGMPPCLQPHVVEPGRFLIATDGGTAALEVRREGGSWRATELWSSRALKPSFDDFVVHGGFLYGFDAGVFSCVDARSGERRWKEGRYGYGQVLLVPDAGLLVVAAESGEAVLLTADPEKNAELGRFQALTGKTWNHPVIAHGRLYLRNAEELACYELKLAR